MVEGRTRSSEWMQLGVKWHTPARWPDRLEYWPVGPIRLAFKATATLVTVAAGGLGSQRSDVNLRRPR